MGTYLRLDVAVGNAHPMQHRDAFKKLSCNCSNCVLCRRSWKELLDISQSAVLQDQRNAV